jgi:hypothetical protein
MSAVGAAARTATEAGVNMDDSTATVDAPGGQATNIGASDTASQVAAQLAEVLRGNPGALRDILAQAGQATGQATGNAAEQVKEKATSRLDQQKQTLVEGLGSVADGIRQMGENLGQTEQGGIVALTARYGDSLAGRLERFSGYLNEREVGDLVYEIEDYARRNSTYFVGGAFLLGLLGARFLKSSTPRRERHAELPKGSAGSRTHRVHSRSEGAVGGTATTSDGEDQVLTPPQGVLP